ncbi:rhodanese-like domain-containing protein [Fluviicola taffensis]|uniref:Rhodanese-like protein n=1 Tax=Fluviicola taffensis (strain DSM 16823 / NCIMB 13979 / RW262) TaxID=755732 RepID=F2ID78_FLUTR|nr:rhodanese-like domain-containing protein [Fluviicola taffensis]AEA45493.1 Rhodanese-like protein [Fluviicola taffensis DSM 16823]
MMQSLKNLFGLGPKVDFNELMSRGAQIIDVRTPSEFNSGHIRGSVNIPLSLIPQNLSNIQKNKPIITCCASGMRSASAKNILKAKGFSEVHNGGGWSSLQQKIQK